MHRSALRCSWHPLLYVQQLHLLVQRVYRADEAERSVRAQHTSSMVFYSEWAWQGRNIWPGVRLCEGNVGGSICQMALMTTNVTDT